MADATPLPVSGAPPASQPAVASGQMADATPLPGAALTRTVSLHDNPTPQSWGPPTSYATKSDKIVCVMVGLPARGKSYISRRLAHYVSFFYGAPTKVFNVGDYRRKEVVAPSADFFDPKNEEALAVRRRASADALADLSRWMAEVVPNRLDSELLLSGDLGALAIFDATNTTRERRAWIIEQLRPTGAKIIFIESICRDEHMVRQNIIEAKVGVKDYQDVSRDAAVADFEARIGKYEEVYEELGPREKEYAWIKLIDGGRELSMNNIRGFLPSRISQFLVNLHVQRRSFYFSRHGQSEYNRLGKIGGDSDLTEHGEAYALELGKWVDTHVMRDAEGVPVPGRLWTSSLLRTRRTARHIPHPTIRYTTKAGTTLDWVQMRPKAFRNLDELYAGSCDGMTYEEIAAVFPEEADARKAKKFEYRYPRGESYTDLLARLEPLAHELERLREPVVIVAHQAVLRVLYAYFMGFPREQCIHVSIPLNTVIQITPTASGCEEKRILVLQHPKGEQLDPASH